jgi:hypothetical protein
MWIGQTEGYVHEWGIRDPIVYCIRREIVWRFRDKKIDWKPHRASFICSAALAYVCHYTGRSWKWTYEPVSSGCETRGAYVSQVVGLGCDL